MPNLVKVWRTEPRFLNTMEDAIKLMWIGGRLHPFREFIRPGLGQWLMIRDSNPQKSEDSDLDWESERKGGRPLDYRTLVAAARLLCFAPYEMVLEQEKKWRIERYLARVKDKNVIRSTRHAKYNAVKAADMCVARAQELVSKYVAEYVEKNPEASFYFLIIGIAAKDWQSTEQLPRPEKTKHYS